MYKNIAATICLLVFANISFAETCPTVQDIKKNNIKGWKIFDSEDDKPLSAEREADFKKNIAQFALAEWTDNRKSHGTVHCYYHDINGSDFEAYLVKDKFTTPPQNGKNYWYQVSGSLHCAAGATQCEFQRVLTNTQLAKS